MRRAAAALLAAVAVVIGVAGCGGSGSGSAATGSAPTVAAAGSATAAGPTGTGSDTAGSEATGSGAAGTEAAGSASGLATAAALTGSGVPRPTASLKILTRTTAQFRTPSSNIACRMDPNDGVRCDINQRAYPVPARPSSCQFDYGAGMILTATQAGFSCISDTVLGQGEIVGYGTEVIVARYSCEVALTGVTCRDRVSGRGFLLSRQQAQVL